VTQWALKKGLERTDLMRLKRLPGLAGSMLGRSFVAKLDKEKAEEEAKRNAKDGVKPKPAAAPQSAAVDVGSEGGIISRRAAGLSIAFSQSDPSLYICGACACRGRKRCGCGCAVRAETAPSRVRERARVREGVCACALLHRRLALLACSLAGSRYLSHSPIRLPIHPPSCSPHAANDPCVALLRASQARRTASS
jgi:hypothetical protein